MQERAMPAIDDQQHPIAGMARSYGLGRPVPVP